MNTNPHSKDALSGNLFVGGNSPPANPNGYNGSPLAASKMDANIKRNGGKCSWIDRKNY